MFEETEENLRTRVKICGIRSLEHARFVSGALVDFIGFIFHDESPRYVTPGEVGAIVPWLEGPQTVGVFVNESIDDVNDIAMQAGVDLVQLHGEETPDYCELIEKPIIKAFRIGEETDFDALNEQLKEFEPLVEYFLFDTYKKDEYGGTGEQFNWHLLKKLEIDKPWFLAGGISKENVKQAVREVNPFAIDVSSSLEREKGEKDFELMADFMDEVRTIWDTQIDD